jgi:hypothetical protein
LLARRFVNPSSSFLSARAMVISGLILMNIVCGSDRGS